MNKKITIWHNPSCSTSRSVLKALQEQGADISIRLYLQDPPSLTELKQLLSKAGFSASVILRKKEKLADELNLKRTDAKESEILDAMVNHPILIERPILISEKKIWIARPLTDALELIQTGRF